MKKIKDFIYDCNDIVIALLIVAIAAAIIFWRVDGIMAYSSYLESKQSKTEIDIDFTDVDLDPISNDPVIEPDPADEDPVDNPTDDPAPVIPEPVPDKSFVSTREVTVVIPKGAGGTKIAGVVADAYGYVNDDYKSFVTSFMDVAKGLSLENKMQYGTFKIPSGSSLETIIKTLARRN